MTSTGATNNYKQGYSSQTVATQQTRTAESEAAFLLPYIKNTDYILDVGCGPGTITTGFVKYASEGRTVGLDLSANVLERAKAAANGAGIPKEGPGSVVFEEGNILEVKALTEMRRVLKPGGILASRDAIEQHFYPRHTDLDRLWVGNFRRAVLNGDWNADLSPPVMPALYRQAGFDADAGKVHVGTGSSTVFGAEARRWLSKRAESQLKPGDPLYRSWREAGITEDEIQETLRASKKWAETEDAWFASLQCEMLAWK